MQESIIYTKFTTELRFLLFLLWQRRRKKKRKNANKNKRQLVFYGNIQLLGNLRNPTGSVFFIIYGTYMYACI